MIQDEVRVIVVDDCSDAAEVLACALELDGYTVKTCGDGAEALALAEGFHPHCILLDVDMPNIDGLELSKRLRARYGDNIVLIAVTGGSAQDARVAETFALVDHYLQKPFETRQLQRLLPPLTSGA